MCLHHVDNLLQNSHRPQQNELRRRRRTFEKSLPYPGFKIISCSTLDVFGCSGASGTVRFCFSSLSESVSSAKTCIPHISQQHGTEAACFLPLT